MAKLTIDIIEDLYLYGKKVYLEEISIQEAVEVVLQKHPQKIADTSAKFYMELYDRLIDGRGSTWNQNSELLLYYVENITRENGIPTGNNAMAAAIKFAKAKSKKQLIKALKQLGEKLGLNISEIDGDEGVPKDGDWWPSLSEYTPGISKEQWLDFLGKMSIMNADACAALMAFYDEGGVATCKQIGNKYGKSASIVNGILTGLARSIAKLTGCPLAKNEGKYKYWPVLFQGKDAGKEESGIFLWKLRPELSDAIEESDIEKYRWKVGEKPVPLTAKETLDLVKKYIAGRGFYYEDGLIENFYLSLKSKPFVILAGTSGTGKTRLVRLFAEAIGATAANKRYLQVAVRPDSLTS